MLLKLVVCSADEQIEVLEISNYYTECGSYLEAAIGKDAEISDRQIIIQDGLEYLSTVDGEGDDCWEECIILSDTGLELLKIKNGGK